MKTVKMTRIHHNEYDYELQQLFSNYNIYVLQQRFTNYNIYELQRLVYQLQYVRITTPGITTN